MGTELVREIAIPAVALGLGALLLPFECTRTVGKLVFYFGAQTGMALYMKTLLSGAVVSEEEGLRGLPAGFAVSAIQQLTAFIVFLIWALVSQYRPKKFTTWRELALVSLYSVSFTANIALNNYSLSLVPLSVNLIIRACLPFPTFLAQQFASLCINKRTKKASFLEIALVIIGVVCAAMVVAARTDFFEAEMPSGQIVGVVICVISVFAGSINLVLAGVLGETSELNSLGATFYMSLPAVVILAGPVFLFRHPVAWPGHELLTDWEIVMKVFTHSPFIVGLAFLSGVFAFGYNVLQFSIVQSLSATHTAFAGNFNKAATIALALLVGLDRLPAGRWGFIMIAASIGSICAFTAYSLAKMIPQNKNKDSPRNMNKDSDELGSLLAEPASLIGSGNFSGAMPGKCLEEGVPQPNLTFLCI